MESQRTPEGKTLWPESSKELKEPIKLNLGCGPTKLKGFVNIDADESLKPDKVLTLGKDKFPFEPETVSEVWCNHTLEHIEKHLHDDIYLEIHRICKFGAKVYLSFPNVYECAKRWKDNYKGDREFWEKTIFGRVMSEWDRHVCAIDRDLLAARLIRIGFNINYCGVESGIEPYNSLVVAEKARAIQTRESVFKREIFDAR